MTKLDRRIARTRRLLREALISIGQESPYDEITIRSLTKRADIGYATFYRHFRGKDELLMHTIMHRLHELQFNMSRVDSLRAEAETMFLHLYRFPQLYRFFFSLPESNIARRAVRAEIEKMMLERYKPKEGATIPLELAIDHIYRSGSNLLCWYLDNLDDYTPQEVTAMYADLISRETTAVALERRPDWPPRSAGNHLVGDNDTT